MGETAQEIYGEVIGIDMLHFAKVTSDTKESYVAETPKYFAPAGELKNDTKVTTTKNFYDGVGMYNYANEDGNVTSTVPGLSNKLIAEILSKPYDATNGIMYDSGDPNPGFYAFGGRLQIKGNDGKNYYKYFWYLKGTFGTNEADAKTRNESGYQPASQDVEFTPVQTVHQFTVPDPNNATGTIKSGLKAVKADTTDSNFKGADAWFSKVQVPAESTESTEPAA